MIIAQMRANPAGDWKIKHIETACRQCGLTLQAPSGGSHFKVTSDRLAHILTVPARRPIKPIYIRHLVAFAQAHADAEGKALS